MSPLAIASTCLGVFIVASRLPGLVAPARFREQMLKLPRSVLWGRVIFLVVALWAGFVLLGAAKEARDETIRMSGEAGIWGLAPAVVVLGVPVAYWLVIQYAEQFLALRATAALMLLVANIVIRAADRSDLLARLVVTTFMYVWVVVGIWMAIAPHHFRNVIEWAMANDRRCRQVCAVGTTVGVVLIALGALVY